MNEDIEIDINVILNLLTVCMYDEESWETLVQRIMAGTGFSREKTLEVLDAFYRVLMELEPRN
jgi:hypothetical protein